MTSSFTPPTIAVNGTSSLAFTITNPNAGSSLTGVSFTDTLPAGVTVPNASGGVCGGTLTLTAPGGITFTGATIAASSQCLFSVTVTGATAGAKINTTSAVTSNEGGSGSATTATLTVGTSATSTSLVSSKNPSSVGEPVTFTATVSGAGATGTVTFKDGASVLGTGTLGGGLATFVVATLSTGSHSITAVYGGDAAFAGSTSSALAQLVNVPADSIKLRALQIAVTKIVSQTSGAAVSGAVDAAIGEGFSDGGSPITASDNGFHVNFAAEPQQGISDAKQQQVNDAFAALGYAGRDGVTKAPSPRPEPKQWLAWADVRGSNWSTSVQTGDIRGGQINALFGISHKVTPALLVGAFGGYENFDYTSELLAGRLKGEGWTVGGYMGWRIAQDVRFDASVARAGISYDGVAGTAAATFPGQRWIATAALVGMYKTAGFEIEPSARIYAVWEHEDAYTDSLGIAQTERSFSNGRASAGTKVAYPWMCSPGVTLTPYVGFYGDYYFNSDDATLPLTPLLLPTQFLQGWSARVTSGLGVTMAHGARVSVGGEVGGLGSDQFTMWSVRGRASVPF
nr:Ig-like domain repeat protein [Bradyrhizobium manausense]